MLTTFARIAKILKGLVEPRNWVEEAFGDISGGGGGGGVLVEVTVDTQSGSATSTKTWQEMFDSKATSFYGHVGNSIVFQPIVKMGHSEDMSVFVVESVSPDTNEDEVIWYTMRYECHSPNEYPALQP